LWNFQTIQYQYLRYQLLPKSPNQTSTTQFQSAPKPTV